VSSVGVPIRRDIRQDCIIAAFGSKYVPAEG
jgi:hypothetical protein